MMVGDDPQVCGVSAIADGRWIQWSLEWSVSTNRCILTLNEKWFMKDLQDNSVRIHFDEFSHERPPSIFIESIATEPSNSICSLSVCIAHYDGTIQRLMLQSSDKSSSFLVPLKALNEYNSFSLVKVLWSGIMQTDNFERATLALHSVDMKDAKGENIIMAVSSEGVLRLWNTRSKKCVIQTFLSQALQDLLKFETLEDAKISAALAPTEDSLQITIALNFRNLRGGEKEWHIAVMEVNLADVSASVIGNNEGRLRLTSLLAPPSCPSALALEQPRPVSPVLLDLQLYRSGAASVLLAAWRWHWTDSSSYNEDLNTVTQNALASHIISSVSTISVVRASMIIVDSDSGCSVKRLQQYSKEDLAVYESLADSNVEVERNQSERMLQHAMIQRVFLPERFSIKMIASVLANSVPLSCRLDVTSSKGLQNKSEMLASCVLGVLKCCTQWGELMNTEAEASNRLPPHQANLQTQAGAFLFFLELCERCADVTEGFTAECLQRPVSRPTPYSPSHTVTVAVCRKTVGFTYLTLPVEGMQAIPLGLGSAPTSSQVAGNTALQSVSAAVDLQPDLCTDLDISLQQTFNENAVLNSKNLSWLSDRIAGLAASVQSLAPSVVSLVQSAVPDDASGKQGCVWLVAIFGVAEGSFRGSLCRPDEPSLCVGTRSSGENVSASATSPSSEFLGTVSRMSGSEIRRMYFAARNKAVLLSLLSSSGGSLHSSMTSLITTDLLPHALFSVVYWGLLQWLSTVRTTDNKVSLESADLFDLFVCTPLEDKHVQARCVMGSDCSSIWEAFCRYSLCGADAAVPLGMEDHLHTATSQLLQGCRPTPTSPLLGYLTHTTQHSAVSRVSSVLLWGVQCVGHVRVTGQGVGDEERRGRIRSLAAVVVHGRLQSSIALAAFLECFRQMLRGRVDLASIDAESSSAASVHRQKRDVHLSHKLYSCLEDLIIAVTSPSTTITDLVELDSLMTGTSGQEFHTLLHEMLGQHSSSLPGYQDSSTLCLRDRLAVMLRRSNAFSALVKELNTTRRDPLSEAVNVCCTSPELFMHLHRIAHLTDIVEMTKRIRDVTVRPKDNDERCYGAALAIRANYALADAVDEALSGLLPSRDSPVPEGLAVRLQLSAEQVVCWSRVFEHAVEQHSFDESLGAVVRLVELAHSYDTAFGVRVTELLESFGVSGWRAALGSMVLHACSTGRLGWLCSLNDIWVKGVHISGAISEELERLASSGYSSVDGINSPSYYECSCVFALSRQNLQEAARMSVMQVQTLDRQQTSHMLGEQQTGMVTGSAQTRALSVAVVALSVTEPEHAAFVLIRTRAASANNKRQYSAAVGDEEEKGYDQSEPSDDPLSMLTVQQLSTSLQLRLAVSKMSPSHKNGSKQATALHLAMSLEELGEQHKPLDDFLDGASTATDILSRCAGSRFPKGHASSSSGRSAVVFAMASAAASQVRQNSQDTTASADHRLHSEFSPQGGRGLTQGKGKSSLHPWTPILDALAHFDSAAQNWALHRSAFEGMLKENILEIPPALVQSFRSVGGDMAALLRVLMAHGYLLEACHIATSLVQSVGDRNNLGKQIVPYNIIDEVIIAARNYFTLSSAVPITSLEEQKALQGLRASLQSELSQLEMALKRHFTLILAAELK